MRVMQTQGTLYWVAGLSGKTAYREMRVLGGLEKQPKSEALGAVIRTFCKSISHATLRANMRLSLYADFPADLVP